MKVFVAGASGAIGQPLVRLLVARGHQVLALTHSTTGGELTALGAQVVQASVLDSDAVQVTFRQFRPDAVIDELTALPKDPAQMAAAAEWDRKVRIEGGAVLLAAAHATGVRRYIQQSSGFFLEPGEGLGDESTPLAIQASPQVAAFAATYTEIEERLFAQRQIEGVALRYGFFYGPNTWFNPDGAYAELIRKSMFPIIGEGSAVWSWIHVDDAAEATLQALTAPPAVYNVTDDRPEPVRVWLPAFARWVGAPAPPQVTGEQALAAAGEDAVYYGTKLRGASNRKAREVLGLRPRTAPWYLSGAA